MLDILKSLIQEQGQSAVVQNNEVPNEHNDAVIQEAEHSIFSGLQQMAKDDPQQLQQLVDADGDGIQDNPAVNNVANNFAGNITSKFGIPSGAAKSLAMMLIPIVLGKLFKKAKDPNDKSIGLNDILGGLVGGGGLGGMLGGVLGGNQHQQ